ncbi:MULTISPECIES: hypothetical protein [Pseudovibrio]|uniref:hypothetical protein n=1 Tax=Stappiaceae TaxID=2821832 RepID=UPI0023669623|nr:MULTISPECIES: hypothetical protein [Pseudovibrio]MDD7911867.1 hypothetical protein [Pseudovibrio exalbescens]MDX5594686.1 hypothetical protein [Pseudovibrio sp. SPO723]
MAHNRIDQPRIRFEDLPLSFRIFVYGQILPILALGLYILLVDAPASAESLLYVFLPYVFTPMAALQLALFWKGAKDLRLKLSNTSY